MKYVYIAGLEHSGTTLLCQMIANAPNTLALGEVGQFLSSTHMDNFVKRWGQYPVSRRCSCGADWEECSVWSKHLDLTGMSASDDSNLADRFTHLLKRLSTEFPQATLIDSSKSRSNLRLAKNSFEALGFDKDNFLVVTIFKDPRAFAYSMWRKDGGKNSFLNAYRAMNLWAFINAKIFEYLTESAVKHVFIPYEQLCSAPQNALKPVFDFLAVDKVDVSIVSHENSHIAIGNTDFLEKNRSEIRVDDAWKNRREIGLAYLLNSRARKLMKKLRLIS